MKFTGFLFRVLLLLCPLAIVDAGATSKPTVPVDEHWSEVEADGFDLARLVRDADLSGFTSVLVRRPTLAFDDAWLREHGRDMTDRDEVRLRDSYPAVLQEALETSLRQETGLARVDEVSDNTLVVEPHLVDFRLNAPDLAIASLTRHYVEHVGSARLQVQLIDGASGRVIGELSDHDRTRRYGGLQDLRETNRVVNLRDFKWLSRKWGKRLGEFVAHTRAQAL